MCIREETPETGECWQRRSRLERVLIMVLLLLSFVIMILLLRFLVARYPQETPPTKICDSITCLNEAAAIMQSIDPNIDPCEDFYQFACGTFLKNAHGDEKLSEAHLMQEQKKRQLIEMYVENIRDDEHKMVKSAKKLFRECMNETKIDNDSVKTITKVLQAAGGWPVVDGFVWDEKKFDWLQATYKLREFGYDYAIFFDLQIESDKTNNDRYIYRVETARSYDQKTVNPKLSSEHIKKMTEAAIIFKAREFTDEISKEMEATYQFQEELENTYKYSEGNRTNVEAFQQMYGDSFDWLSFINTVAGHKAQITKNDFVIFHPPQFLMERLNLISRTPKRTQANYMMWKVVEQLFPVLVRNLGDLQDSKEEHTTRSELCLNEIEKRYLQSPMEIMYSRKYLPPQKRKLIQNQTENIKLEYVEAFNSVSWMGSTDKLLLEETLNNTMVVIGWPGNYYDDKVLDDLDEDMIENSEDTFLDLLAQATRNTQTIKYSRITKFPSQNIADKWYVNEDKVVYDREENVLFIPHVLLNLLFDERMPNYVKFSRRAALYTSIVDELATADDGWSKQTQQAYKRQEECLLKKIDDNELNWTYKNTVSFVIVNILADKISYAAYQKLTEKSGKEPELIGAKYTPLQIFWISKRDCVPVNLHSVTFDLEKNPRYNANIDNEIRRNNPNFAKDFNCSRLSKMYPRLDECQII